MMLFWNTLNFTCSALQFAEYNSIIVLYYIINIIYILVTVLYNTYKYIVVKEVMV